jgi:hypothetical protein
MQHACQLSLWLANRHVGMSDLPVPIADLARGL